MARSDDCTLATCPIEDSIYTYRPSIPANAILLAIFALSGLVHLAQMIRWRSPAFTIPILLGCTCEIIGYVGRLMLYSNPFSMNGFLIQICCLTLGPAFFSAAIYFCLGDIVRFLGEDASRLRPNQYAWIFVPCDIISLTLQGTGGGMASVATQQGRSGKTGTNIMVAGLAFQVFSMLVFIILTSEFAWRVRQLRRKSGVEEDEKRVTRRKLITFVTPFSLAIFCLFIRCSYRVAELSGGWDSRLIHDEPTFIGLEGAMVAIAVVCLNLGHPKLLQR